MAMAHERVVDGLFLVLLVLAHLQAIGVALALALATSRALPGLRARLPADAIPCLSLAFASFGLAALSETLDHTTTRWLYVNHTSPWNALFFLCLATGIALLTGALASNPRLHAVLVILVMAGAFGYMAIGKGASIGVQVLLLVLMLRCWWRTFHDRGLWLYPLFTVGLTTLFGVLLSVSGDQVWHLFIGPAGSLSLLVLWRILRRAELAEPQKCASIG